MDSEILITPDIAEDSVNNNINKRGSKNNKIRLNKAEKYSIKHPRTVIAVKSENNILPISLSAYHIKTQHDIDLLKKYHESQKSLIVQRFNAYDLEDIIIDDPSNNTSETSSVLSAESASTCSIASSVSAMSLFSMLSDIKYNYSNGIVKIRPDETKITEQLTITEDVIENQMLLTEVYETELSKYDFILKRAINKTPAKYVYDPSKFVCLRICTGNNTLFKHLLPQSYTEYLFMQTDWAGDIFQESKLLNRNIYTPSLTQLVYSGCLCVSDLNLTPTEDLFYHKRSKELLKIQHGVISEEFINRLYTQNVVPDEVYLNINHSSDSIYNSCGVRNMNRVDGSEKNSTGKISVKTIDKSVSEVIDMYNDMFEDDVSECEFDILDHGAIEELYKDGVLMNGSSMDDSNNIGSSMSGSNMNYSNMSGSNDARSNTTSRTNYIYNCPSQVRSVKTSIGYFSYIIDVNPSLTIYSSTPTIRNITTQYRLFAKLYEQYLRNTPQGLITLKILYQLSMNIVSSGKKVVLIIDTYRSKEFYAECLLELLCNKLEFSQCSWNK